MSLFFLDHGSGNAGGNDEHFVHECRRPPAGRGGKRRRLFRLMFPEVRAHFESPRQEEHHSTPAEVKTSTFQRGRLTRWPPGAWGSHERRLPVSMGQRTDPARFGSVVDLASEVKRTRVSFLKRSRCHATTRRVQLINGFCA